MGLTWIDHDIIEVPVEDVEVGGEGFRMTLNTILSPGRHHGGHGPQPDRGDTQTQGRPGDGPGKEGKRCRSRLPGLKYHK